MGKKVLFVCESAENFLVKAMIKNITSAGFDVNCVPRVVDFMSLPNTPDVIIVYLDGDDLKCHEALVKLENFKMSEQGSNSHILLIGNPIEIEAAYRGVKKEHVDTALQRPVNTTDLINKIKMACSGYSLDSENVQVEAGFKGDADKNRKSVLIVDDDTTFLRSMCGELGKKFNVYITNSGMNAISFLKERPVDLVLLDYEMPVVSGLEVFRILRSEEETFNTPVIFLTSKDDKKTIMKVLEVHPENYLLKPIAPTILANTVEDFFKKHAGEKKSESWTMDGEDAPAEMEMIDENFSL